MSNYSDQHFLSKIPDASELADRRFIIITALWNDEVTSKLRHGALNTLKDAGIPDEQIVVKDIPGSYELIYAANKAAYQGFDGIICLGCVIQGETRHFDFICEAVANGIADIIIKHNKPIAFGLLTTQNQEQALERAGGKHGNKGSEAALSVLHLLLN